MGDVANFTDPQARDLPARIGYALAVRELITLPSLAGSTLVAGAGGLDRIVSRVNVIEVPDILPWVKSNELLLTTGFPIRFADSGQPFHPRALVDLIEGLARRRSASRRAGTSTSFPAR